VNDFLGRKIRRRLGLSILFGAAAAVSFSFFSKILAGVFAVLSLRSLSRLSCVFRGAYGEEEAFALLRKKFRDWKIIRNFRTASGDADFVLIGRSGVVLVEVKNLKYPLRVNRNRITYGRSDFLEQLNRNERYVKKIFEDLGVNPPVKSFILVLSKFTGRSPSVVKTVNSLRAKTFSFRRIGEKDYQSICSFFGA
jgi:hypothetical protein